MSEKIHIGDLIKKELKAQDRPVSWLAQKLNYDSSNFYKKLEKKSMDSDLLFRISEIMEEDLFTGYSKILQGKIDRKNR